jgi:phosphoglycerate-specific signal transduction histidine kinase
MKRVLVVVVVLLLGLVVSGCGSKYADVKKLQVRFGKAVEAYAADLEKADDAKSVAKAANRFADEMEVLRPKMNAMSEKYPELKDKDNVPKELEASQKDAEAAGKKMAGIFMKLMPYMTDPEVRKAQERLGKIMSQ